MIQTMEPRTSGTKARELLEWLDVTSTFLGDEFYYATLNHNFEPPGISFMDLYQSILKNGSATSPNLRSIKGSMSYVIWPKGALPLPKLDPPPKCFHCDARPVAGKSPWGASPKISPFHKGPPYDFRPPYKNFPHGGHGPYLAPPISDGLERRP